MRISGVVKSGLGKGQFFTSLPWVVEECKKKIGFAPYPGTLNLELLPEAGLPEQVAGMPGVPIPSPDPEWCDARAIPVRINGLLPGAIILASKTVHPPESLEILAPVNLRRELDLKDGDEVELEFGPFSP